MKKVILILSHCNTEEKVNTLKDIIRDLKRFGMPIALHSHIPLDKEVLESVDYFVCDKNNPIISNKDKGMKFWIKHPNPENDKEWVVLESILDDYGYTPLNQIKGGGNYLLNTGFDYIYFVNYDSIIDDNFRDIITNQTDSFFTNSLDDHNIPSFMFLGLNKSDFREIDKNVNMKDYIFNFNYFGEQYLKLKSEKLNIPQLDFSIKDKHLLVDGLDNYHMYENYKCDDYFIFIDNTFTHGLLIYFYNTEKPIDKTMKKTIDMTLKKNEGEEITNFSFDSNYIYRENLNFDIYTNFVLKDNTNNKVIDLTPIIFGNNNRQEIKIESK